jgi:hypothetical protein
MSAIWTSELGDGVAVLQCCGECEWWIRRSQYSHGPDPRKPQPLPAGLSVDVTAKRVVSREFIISNVEGDGGTNLVSCSPQSPAVAPRRVSANVQHIGWQEHRGASLWCQVSCILLLRSGFVDEASFTDSVGSLHHSRGGRVPVGRHTVIPVAVKGRTEVGWDLECQMAPEMVRLQLVLSVVSCCSAGG